MKKINNKIISEDIDKDIKLEKKERKIALEIFDVKIILGIFMIVLIIDIKDDLWKIKKLILEKYKNNSTMLPSTILFFVIFIGYFVWLYLYNKQKKIFEMKKANNTYSSKDLELFKKETIKIKSYRNALLVGLCALSIALLLYINKLLPVFLFNFIITFYYGISSF